MDLIKQLFWRTADADRVSETTTMDQLYQSQSLARVENILRATPPQPRTNPGTPMADFQRLSQPQQQQVIIETIHAFIQEERRRNYHFLGNQSHRYMNQEDLLNVSIEDAWYTFTECCPHSLERTASIEIMPLPGSVLTTDNLIITTCRPKSTPTPSTVTEWLRNTYTWDNTWEMRYPEVQYEEQRAWWDNNGKTFPLMALPAEMRDDIYLQAIGPVVLPEYCDKITLGIGLKHKNPRQGSQRDPDVHAPDLMILKVSRQVRREAIEVATRDATKRFRAIQSSVPVICAFMRYLENSARSGFLRVIQLEMTAKRYFELIGISPTPAVPLPQAASGPQGIDMLRTFRALQELDFRFIGPKHKFAVCPWSPSSLTAIHSCQKSWIHWFLVLAWDTLQALMTHKKVKISLSGCVKTSTRKYWQNIFNDGRHDYTPMIKAIEQEIRQQDINGPIACKCSTMCGKDPGVLVVQWSEHEMRKIEGLREETERWYWDFED